MPRISPSKKSPARLDQEVAEALRARTSGGAQHRRPPRAAHAKVKRGKANGKQAGILLVANDAALSGQFERAEEILAQSQPRTIATAFTTVTEESSAAGDYASRGWEDEDGEAIEVNAGDIEEAADSGSHAPVSDAIARKAAQWLWDHGASEASSSAFHRGVWYETEFAMDYGSGEEKQEEFFLRDFNEDEERRVFDEFYAGRRR